MKDGFSRSNRLIRIVFTFFILAIFLTVSIYFNMWLDVKKCSVCQRQIDPRMVYRFILADGTSKKVCCPRCCLTYQMQTGANVESAIATDFETGKEIDSKRAFYVEGSNLTPCCCGLQVMVNEYKIHYFRLWDRCLPSLIAFERLESAFKFQRQHGGSIITYKNIKIQ